MTGCKNWGARRPLHLLGRKRQLNKIGSSVHGLLITDFHLYLRELGSSLFSHSVQGWGWGAPIRLCASDA
jgi:hypothetical protein